MRRPSESNRQLDLFDVRRAPRELRVAAASRLADALAERLAEQVRVTIHDNRSTMVSFRRDRGLLHYRIHHMFLDAPQEVVRALATFAAPARGMAARRRDAGTRIDAYVRQLIESQSGPEVTIAWQGGEPTLMGVDFFRRAIGGGSLSVSSGGEAK